MKKGLFIGVFLALLLSQGTCFAVPYDQYTAVSGDSFWTISQKAGVSVASLKNINPQVDPDNVTKGLFINLPSGHKPLPGLIPAREVSKRTYTVKSGETFFTISRTLGLNFTYLMQANPQIQDKNNLKPGQVINIPTKPIAITSATNWVTKADYMIAMGKDQFDVPYVWGGMTPFVALDCSSFTQYLYKQIGVNLPRTSNWQFQYGTPVPKDQLRKGDLVFFKEEGSTVVTHVGMYIGNDLMLNEDYEPKNGVQITRLFGDEYYNSCYVGARRYY